MVAIANIEGASTLYRVGRALDSRGLWYDEKGEFHGTIHQLKDGAAGALPMGEHPVFRSEGRRWISTTESLETLRHWFSEADMRELVPAGYVLEKVEVSEFRRFTFETYQHEAYSSDHLLRREILPPSLLYEGLF